MANGTCSIDGCPFPVNKRTWCVAHYHRWWRHGDPSITLRASVPSGQSVEDRFWAKVDKTGDCWLWTASVFRERYGYGKFQAGENRANTRVVYAHRYSWELVNGPVPDGLFVCHHCDNPPCVNPAHLFVGTHQDNVDDMMSKGRHRSQRVG